MENIKRMFPTTRVYPLCTLKDVILHGEQDDVY